MCVCVWVCMGVGVHGYGCAWVWVCMGVLCVVLWVGRWVFVHVVGVHGCVVCGVVGG